MGWRRNEKERRKEGKDDTFLIWTSKAKASGGAWESILSRFLLGLKSMVTL